MNEINENQKTSIEYIRNMSDKIEIEWSEGRLILTSFYTEMINGKISGSRMAKYIIENDGRMNCIF